jgi:protoheme IX farnesyltransferase
MSISTVENAVVPPAVGSFPAAAGGAVRARMVPAVSGRASFWSGCADYLALAKPRVVSLVLFVVAAVVIGFGAEWTLLLPLLAGTALIAASASALNQWMERSSDRLMTRTADRAMARGRISAAGGMAFAVLCLFTGAALLARGANVQAALAGLATWAAYVGLYTPLKRRTIWNTAIGAFAGAAPIMIGAAACDQWTSLAAWTLFLILFAWQFPHFMAIAWLYRSQYAAAGLRMLPSVDSAGRRTAACAVTFAALLLPLGLAPLVWGASALFTVPAALLGLVYLWAACGFARRRDDASARFLLRASLVYLPALLGLWALFSELDVNL